MFVEFSAYEHGLNCGLDFRAEVCETFFHHIRRDMMISMGRVVVSVDGMCCWSATLESTNCLTARLKYRNQIFATLTHFALTMVL